MVVSETELNTMKRTYGLVLAFSWITAVTACTASGGNASGGLDGGRPASATSVTVNATNGGSLGNQQVELSIPAGAVSEATEVSLTVDAPSGTASNIFRYTPDGLSLAVAAQLTVSLAGVGKPLLGELQLARYSDGAWLPVADAVTSADAIHAPITALGSFALVAAQPATGACQAACMAQPGAQCCSACGCEAKIACQPTCAPGSHWDCEVKCCFDNAKLACAG